MSLFAVTPRVLRQALASSTRTAIQYNWQVATVVSDTEITVSLRDPAVAVPYLTTATASYYENALVEFTSGVLGGIEPNSGGKPSTSGRVSVPIQSIASTANAGEPPTTTITFADALPATPAKGDRFVVYYAQVGSYALTVAGSVDVGTIAGTVTIQPASDATFDINTVAGTVTVTPATDAVFDIGTVTGTVAVEPASGATFDIGTVSGTVTVVPSSDAVFNVGNVSGTVTVTPGSGAVFDVGNISGTVTVQFNGTQTVTWDVTGPVNVQNVSLTAIPLVAWTEQSFDISLAAGASQTLGVYPGAAYLSEYDGLYIRLNSSGQQVPNLAFKVVSTSIQEYGLISSSWALDVSWRESNSAIALSNFVPLSPSAVFDNLSLQVTNNGTTTDTETLTIQVYARYAGALVTNPQTNPVQSQAASGSFDTTAYTNGGSSTSSADTLQWTAASAPSGTQCYAFPTSPLVVSQTIIPSGNYLSELIFGAVDGSAQCSATLTISLTNGINSSDIEVQTSCTAGNLFLQLFNGSQLLCQTSVAIPAGSNTSTTSGSTTTVTATATLDVPTPFTYGRGAANNGIILVATAYLGQGCFASASLSGASATPTVSAVLEVLWNPAYLTQGSANPPANVTVVS